MIISFELRFETTQTNLPCMRVCMVMLPVNNLFHLPAELSAGNILPSPPPPLLVEANPEPSLLSFTYSLNHLRSYFGSFFGEFKFLTILWLNPSNF